MRRVWLLRAEGRGQQATFLLHDGNKNVTDVVTVGPRNSPVAHYEYAPFGAATHTGPRALDNPFRFSSEFADDTLGLVYYNYRHYNPTHGRWLGRDKMGEGGGRNLFALSRNSLNVDHLGLFNLFAPVEFIWNGALRFLDPTEGTGGHLSEEYLK